METKERTFLLGLMLFLCLALQAQMESHLTYRRYVTQDGLPQMQTERLWQDSRGYIYIGTLSGFVRFDGQSFTPFLKGRRMNIVGFAEIGDEQSPSATPGEVRALGFFRQWRVDYDHVESLPLDPKGHWLLNNLNAGSLPNGYVLMEDSLEQHRRLCRMTRKGVETLLAHELLDAMTPDRKLFMDDAGDGKSTLTIFLPTSKGLFRMEKGRQPQRLSERSDIYTLLRTDTVLLAFVSDGIFTVNRKSLTRVATADWQTAAFGLTVRALHSGHLVIADEHSVWLYDGKQVRQMASGINLIRDMLVDRWDRLWVATYQGLYCFFNRCFTNHRLTDENDIVRAVTTNDAGQLVMGTLNGKVIVRDSLEGTTVISNDPEQYYAPNAVRTGRTVYMAGNGDVACVTRQADGTSSLGWLGLPHDRYQFVASVWGKVVAGSRTGIISYDPTSAAIDTLTMTILHPWCAAQDARGLLWIGSSSGLFSIDKTHRVVKTDYPQKLIITTMEADSRGTVFFASADSLFMIRDGQVETLQQQMPQLCGHEVRSLHVSPRGYLVVAVIDGLFVGRISGDYQVTDVHFFNQQNGFTMTEPLKTMMAESSDGTVWLPGVEQMTSFSPEALLAMNEEETYIAPPLRWWQHWWVWTMVVLVFAAIVWAVTRWYEKRRSRRRMIRLQHEKMIRQQQIEAIRQRAIQEQTTTLSQDIVRMTDKTESERLTFRTASGTIVVDIPDIAFFKGDGNYSQIVTFHDKNTVLTGLGALEKMLSPDIFVRADRSTLVNIHNISNLLPRQRRCIFRAPNGIEVETTLLAPAFKRLQALL